MRKLVRTEVRKTELLPSWHLRWQKSVDVWATAFFSSWRRIEWRKGKERENGKVLTKEEKKGKEMMGRKWIESREENWKGFQTRQFFLFSFGVLSGSWLTALFLSFLFLLFVFHFFLCATLFHEFFFLHFLWIESEKINARNSRWECFPFGEKR